MKPRPNKRAARIVRRITEDLLDRRWIKARFRELPPKTRALIWRAWFEIVSEELARS